MSRWRTLRFEFQAMASPCTVQIDGQDERRMRQAAQAAMTEVRRIERKFSRYQASSVVSRINRQAGLSWVDVDEETQGLMDFADQLWHLSDGLFDISSGVLRQAWNFHQPRLPLQSDLDALLACVGWQHIERRGRQVRLPRTGMELDFGGIGKEYAADRAAAVLQSQGLQHALVNLGGDIHALGARGLPELNHAPWNIHIQTPRAQPGDVAHTSPLATLPLMQGGLATSGDYERFFELDGRRYCHVLNPFTGWPVDRVQSVSVLSSNTSSAGAMGTIAMLKGDAGASWLHAQCARFLLVNHDGQQFQNRE